jgi:Zn-finger nucleic acid-binding protein
MMFQGTNFCPHCGARAERALVEKAESEICPRCGVAIETVDLGGTTLSECPKCAGLWVDAACLERICAERERQAAVLGMSQPTGAPASGGIEERVRYLPCPVCKKLMNRVNFAGYSNVIVDVCKNHGTWFDRDELRRVIEFIRSGGLEAARRHAVEELETRQQRLKTAQMAAAWSADGANQEFGFDHHYGISLIADALKSMFRD